MDFCGAMLSNTWEYFKYMRSIESPVRKRMVVKQPLANPLTRLWETMDKKVQKKMDEKERESYDAYVAMGEVQVDE
ncbi:hypothetical protein ACLI4Q_19075 [Natrialbaceae archaeon A-CW1-1]